MGFESLAVGSPMPSTGAHIHRPICPDGREARGPECKTPCPKQSRSFVLAATILTSAMAFIDGSIVMIALPALQNDLAAGFAALQWVTNAYALLLGGLILIGGAAGDRFGRRRVLLVGLAVFAASSLVCALAPMLGVLIVGRAFQGAGAALLVPQSLAIISASFPKAIRGRAIGIWAGASAITTAMGPPLGGILIDAWGWRSVFWINLPLCVVAVWLTSTHVPESRDETVHGPLDWQGALLAIAAFGALTVGLAQLADTSELTSSTVLLALGTTMFLLFVVLERHAVNPLMPLSLFGNRVFSSVNAMTFFLYGALSAVFFLLPFDLIERRGLTATQVGLTLAPFGVIIGALSSLAGDWSDRHGPRAPLMLGSLLLAAAISALAMNIESFWLGVIAPILLMSFAMAIVVSPLTTTVMNAASDTQAGAASGISNATSRLAGLFAVAVAGALASILFHRGLDAATLQAAIPPFGVLPDPGDPARAALERSFSHAYSAALWMMAAWSVAAAMLVWIFVPSRRAE